MAIREKRALKKPVFWAVYLAVIALCVVIDQLTKHYIDIATQTVGGGRKDIPILGDWLLLHWTTNDGATGGMFQGVANRNVLFFITTLIGLPAFAFMLYRSRRRSVWGQIAFAFIIGGTLGNAADRLFLAKDGFFTGAVRDFVCVTWFFGIFNVADSFLVVGVIMALLAIVFFDPDSLVATVKSERRAKAAEDSAEEHADGEFSADVKTAAQESKTENADEEDRTDV